MAEVQTTTHPFQAEVAAVLRLVTNSLYTNREIFLRELVSNASDALDKARFQALVDESLEGQELPPRIVVTADAAKGVLAVEDTGIGMTAEEAAQNLGTIAHSGTLKFLEQAAARGEKPDVGLIGQFGVGFYSAFMVAERIDVYSRSALPGSAAVHWSSTGGGSFTLGPSDRAERGTRVELHLRDDAKEFLEHWRLSQLIKRYSDYVLHPILVGTTKDDGTVAEEAKQVNQAKAFWMESPKNLGDDDYAEFYKHVMGGFVLPAERPLARMHVSMDAPIQFKAVLFVPDRRPLDLFQDDAKHLQLYARRVMVMENCDRLLPTFLRFFRGVV
ncbi:MAG TPA: molecular chaperone HtpG, partial [Nannocystaceae bacterium]|nr:molecular chaperone HtpG [Nannocystaceae bacterium]